jgi:hypothetical protein
LKPIIKKAVPVSDFRERPEMKLNFIEGRDRMPQVVEELNKAITPVLNRNRQFPTSSETACDP